MPAASAGPDWAGGLEDGVIVEMTIRRGAAVAFPTQGLPAAAAGAATRAWAEAFDPGLESRYKSVETRARGNLAAHSFPCDAIGLARGKFVPLAAYLDFRQRNVALQREFSELRRDAEAAHASALAAFRDGGRDAVIDAVAAHMPRAEAEAAVDAAAEALPTPAALASTYEYMTSLRRVPSRVLLAAANAGCGGADIPSVRPPLVCMGSKRGDGMDVEAARRQLRADFSAGIGRAADEAAGDFLLGSVLRLRTMAADGGDRVVASIDRNDGVLVGRASIMAHNLVGTIRALDFYGDADLQEAADWLDYELDGRPLRDAACVRAAAESMAAWARRSAEWLESGATCPPPAGVGADRRLLEASLEASAARSGMPAPASLSARGSRRAQRRRA